MTLALATDARSGFLAGGGEMGGRIRALNWASTSLGPPAAWPQGLRIAARTALTTRHPIFIFWGPEHLCLYNDGYSASLGPEKHPGILGRPGREAFTELWHIIGPQIELVMRGEGATWHENHLVPLTRNALLEDVYWTYSYGPIDDESAPDGVGGVLVICTETTQTVLSERRQSFRIALDERLGKLRDPEQAMMAAVTALGEHLGADRVGYGQVLADDLTVRLSNCYAPQAAPLMGDFPLDGFGPDSIARQRRGEVEVCNDVRADPGQDEAVWAAIDTRAFVSVPLVREGRFSASLYVNSRAPRRWSPEEVALIEAVAARTWDAIDRAAAEAALAANEARTRFALHAGRLGAWELELGSGRMTTSPMCRVNFGRDPAADFSYEDLRAAVHPGDSARMAATVERCIATGADYDIAYRVVTPAGAVRWVEIRAKTSYAEDRTPLRMTGVSLDVTDRRLAEERLRELNETLEAQVAARTTELRFHRDIIEATTSPVCAFDTEYRLIAYNRAHSDEFFRIFGHRVELGEVFPDLFPPDQAPTMRVFMTRALAGERYTVAEEFGDPGLAKPYWEVNYTPLRDEAGRVVGAFHLAHDITVRLRAEAELRSAQDALRQSQKMEAMGQLTGGVAHDFNNLLTPIIGGLDMLQRRALGSEREQRLIGGALESAERAKVLVQRLLAFARRQPLQPAPVDLSALIRGMTGLIESTLGPRIEMRVALAADLPAAVADANQLEMAILNLGVNARDAMAEGGVLTISAARPAPGAPLPGLMEGEYVRLSVADTGVGMDAATLARAVEPFFSTKGIGKGTGLGLSMVHGLAAQLGGGLAIASEPGRGTTIDLWLPVSLAPAAREVASDAATGASARKGRALLVDDEPTVRMSIAHMLIDLGYDVIEAGSAEEALRLLQGGTPPDLLVTDHLMPGMDGVDLIRRVRQAHPSLPALIVSGYADVEGLDPDLPRLTRPFRNAELAERLGGLLHAPPD